MADNTLKIAPFLRSDTRNEWIYLDILLALFPLCVWGTVAFGFRVPLLLLLSAGGAVLVRFLWNLVAKKRKTEDLLGAAATGLLTALCLTTACSYYLALLCGAVASGLRILTQKVDVLALHPVALTVLLQNLAFPGWFPQPFTQKIAVSEVFVRTPAAGVLNSPLQTLFGKQIPDITVLDLLLGNCAGTIGEVSAVLIFFGFLYLCFKKVIPWKGSLQFLGAAAATAFLIPVTLDNFGSMWAELFGGATFFGAVFLANDYDTSPKTDMARMVYFVGCGVLSILFRYVISFTDGVFAAVLLMGLLSGLLDKFLAPRMFGRGKAPKLNYSRDVLEDLPEYALDDSEEDPAPKKE